MNISRNVVTEQEQRELIELARRYHVLKGLEVTNEALKETFRQWRDYAGIFFDGSLWEYVQKKVEEAEFLAKIDAEALTCEGRRRAIALCLGEPSEDYTDPLSVLGLYQEDLRWLQVRTGEEDNELIKDFESLQSAAIQILCRGLMSQSRGEQDQVNKLERKFDLILAKAHQLMLKEKQRLERKLLIMHIKARKPAIFRPYLKARTPSFRRPRAPRRSSRSAAVASRGGGDDGGGGDPDQSAPPRPRLLPVLGIVTLSLLHSHNSKAPWRRRRPGTCRMARYLRPVPRSRHGCLGPP